MCTKMTRLWATGGREPGRGSHHFHSPRAQSATHQRAPRRHPGRRSVGLGAGWLQPGRPRWGRRPAHCSRKDKTAEAPARPGLPGHAVLKTQPERPKPSADSLPYGPPLPPTLPAFCLHLLLLEAEGPGGLAARCYLGSSPSAATDPAPECFGFLVAAQGTVRTVSRSESKAHGSS